MQETRQNRISRLLQKELATIFQSQTRMMHGVMVSVTRVRVSPDLSICTAYLSIFPSDKGEEMLKNIIANDKAIRYDLGQRVRNQLRVIPELRFFIDDSLAYIEHIEEIGVIPTSTTHPCYSLFILRSAISFQRKRPTLSMSSLSFR